MRATRVAAAATRVPGAAGAEAKPRPQQRAAAKAETACSAQKLNNQKGCTYYSGKCSKTTVRGFYPWHHNGGVTPTTRHSQKMMKFGGKKMQN